MSQICVNNLTFSYEGSPDTVFENVSFSVDTSWKLGFAGRNGKGKTTFLRLLMGAYPYSGTIACSTRFDYFPIRQGWKRRGGPAQSWRNSGNRDVSSGGFCVNWISWAWMRRHCTGLLKP